MTNESGPNEGRGAAVLAALGQLGAHLGSNGKILGKIIQNCYICSNYSMSASRCSNAKQEMQFDTVQLNEPN